MKHLKLFENKYSTEEKISELFLDMSDLGCEIKILSNHDSDIEGQEWLQSYNIIINTKIEMSGGHGNPYSDTSHSFIPSIDKIISQCDKLRKFFSIFKECVERIDRLGLLTSSFSVTKHSDNDRYYYFSLTIINNKKLEEYLKN